MIKILKYIYRFFRTCWQRILFFFSVNWIKTLYFNFRMLPFRQAKKLPVFFYGSVKFSSLKGTVIINSEIKKGMIGFGQPYEMNTRSKGISEIYLKGNMVFNGHVQFGKDYFIYLKENSYCEMGHLSSMGTNAKLICVDVIKFGDYSRLGSECQVIDTNFHQMFDVVTNERFPLTSPIHIGSYNFVSNRVTILSKTVTSDYTTIASNSLCNRDYTEYGSNVLIGGIPSKLLKSNISRDWEGENERLLKHLKVK